MKNKTLHAIVALIAIGPLTAKATIIYESATLGTTGFGSGHGLTSQFLGSRFSLSQATQIDSIAGHMFTFGGGTLWGALFPLANANTALPTFGAMDPSGFSLAHTILTPTATSSEVTGALVGGPIILAPGAYGIVFGGGGFYGTTAPGGMPQGVFTGSTEIGSPKYFFRGTDGIWNNGGLDRVRFVVNGAVVPIPAALWLFGSGLGMLGWIRRRQTA